MNKQTIISISIIGLAIIIGLIILQSASNKAANRPGEHDALASCIAESGATFYGAFWCPHCNSQKQAFGKSAGLLPYSECSTPDGQGQTAVCTEMGIESYPTWVLADGTRVSGVQSLETLAALTGCEAALSGSEENDALPEDAGQTSEAVTETE
jgi:hypothetical protein